MFSTILQPVFTIINLIIEINTSMIFGFSSTEVELSKNLKKSIIISIIAGIILYFISTYTQSKFLTLWIYLILIPLVYFYFKIPFSQVVAIILLALTFDLCIMKILEYNVFDLLLFKNNMVDDPMIQGSLIIFQSLSNIVITMIIYNSNIVFLPKVLFENVVLDDDSASSYNTSIYSIGFILINLNFGLFIMFSELHYFRSSFRILLAFWSIIISLSLLVYLRSSIEYKNKLRDILYDRQHQQEILSYYSIIRSQRHDFNFHLNAIYALINEENYVDCKEYIEDVVKDARYINELLPLYHPIIGAMLNTFKEMAIQKGVQVHYYIYDDLRKMPCSVYEMNKILGNLIQNAIDEVESKTLNSPEINVEISQERGSIVLKITNTTEIEKDHLEDIFDIGYSTKDVHEGLGLPTVKRILSKYNGIIYPEILEGEISFVVRIPIIY